MDALNLDLKVGKGTLPGLDLIIGVLALIVIGAIIILLLKLLILFIPVILVAIVAWLFTGNELFAGLPFLFVALLGLLRKL